MTLLMHYQVMKMSRPMLWGCLLLSLATSVNCNTEYINSDRTCGKTFYVGYQAVSIRHEGGSNRVNYKSPCFVYLELGYSDSDFKFEIALNTEKFRGCSRKLSIYDGHGVGGNELKTIDCNSSAFRGTFYPKGTAVTILLNITGEVSPYERTVGIEFSVYAEVYIRMDNPAMCGKTYSIKDDKKVEIRDRGDIMPANPVTTCIIYLESGYTDSNFKFQIETHAGLYTGYQYRTKNLNCSMELSIYDGRGIGGNLIKSIGCDGSNRKPIYSNQTVITLVLNRTGLNDFRSYYFVLFTYVYIRMDYEPMCDKTYTVKDEAVRIQAKGSDSFPGMMVTTCTVYLQSGYTGGNYKFEIDVTNYSSDICDVQLTIYDGLSIETNPIETIGCDSPRDIGNIYPNQTAIAVKVKRKYHFSSEPEMLLYVRPYKAFDIESSGSSFVQVFTTTTSIAFLLAVGGVFI